MENFPNGQNLRCGHSERKDTQIVYGNEGLVKNDGDLNLKISSEGLPLGAETKGAVSVKSFFEAPAIYYLEIPIYTRNA